MVGADKQLIHLSPGQAGTDSRLFLSPREVGALPGAGRAWPFCTAGTGAGTREAGNPSAAISATGSQANAPSWQTREHCASVGHGTCFTAALLLQTRLPVPLQVRKGSMKTWKFGSYPLLLGHRKWQRWNLNPGPKMQEPALPNTGCSIFIPFLPVICSPLSLLPSILLFFSHIYEAPAGCQALC